MKLRFVSEERIRRGATSLLIPLSWLYGCAVRLRNTGFDRGILKTYKSALPVISIGNITVGGTGKTPLTLWIASQLASRGWRPVVLSRGYGGTVPGPHVVASDDSAGHVGDEPLLLARRAVCPVVICRKRVTGAQFIEQRQLGNVIVLDDGHQHRWLDRSINIVVVGCGDEAAVDALCNGWLLPTGRLREPRSTGLKRADVVILSQRGGDPSLAPAMRSFLIQEIPPAVPIFSATVAVQPPMNCSGVTLPSQTPVWMLSAIAGPQVLNHTMSRLGYPVIGQTYLPDHAPLPRSLVTELCREAANHGAYVVCTEKDWVKIPSAFQEDLYYLQVDSEVDRPADLLEVIDLTIRQHAITYP